MTTGFLTQDIARDEGCRLAAYPDPLSGGEPWTIGYGCTGPDIHNGTVWTQLQADAELTKRIQQLEVQLDHALSWWRTLNDPRQDVMVNMAYNLGIHGLLGFPRALAAIQVGDFAAASSQMLNSAWANQVGVRARRLAAQMKSGDRAE